MAIDAAANPKSTSSIQTLNNGESALSIRNKINNNFTHLKGDIKTQIDSEVPKLGGYGKIKINGSFIDGQYFGTPVFGSGATTSKYSFKSAAGVAEVSPGSGGTPKVTLKKFNLNGVEQYSTTIQAQNSNNNSSLFLAQSQGNYILLAYAYNNSTDAHLFYDTGSKFVLATTLKATSAGSRGYYDIKIPANNNSVFTTDYCFLLNRNSKTVNLYKHTNGSFTTYSSDIGSNMLDNIEMYGFMGITKSGSYPKVFLGTPAGIKSYTAKSNGITAASVSTFNVGSVSLYGALYDSGDSNIYGYSGTSVKKYSSAGKLLVDGNIGLADGNSKRIALIGNSVIFGTHALNKATLKVKAVATKLLQIENVASVNVSNFSITNFLSDGSFTLSDGKEAYHTSGFTRLIGGTIL